MAENQNTSPVVIASESEAIWMRLPRQKNASQ